MPCAVVPEKFLGPIELVLYVDGSEIAYAGLIYLCYLIKKHMAGPWYSGLGIKKGWVSNLLTSKARVTPSEGLTASCAEINSFIHGFVLQLLL